MKGRIILALAALASAPLSSASADQKAFAALVKTLDPVLGYWSFEGDYKDQTGKGNDGKASGNLDLIKFCPGANGGQAVQFDNATEQGQFISVKAPIGGAFDSPTISVFIWANRHQRAGGGSLGQPGGPLQPLVYRDPVERVGGQEHQAGQRQTDL